MVLTKLSAYHKTDYPKCAQLNERGYTDVTQ